MAQFGKRYGNPIFEVRIGDDKMLTHEYSVEAKNLDSAEQKAIGKFFDRNPLDKIRFVAVSLL